MRAGMSVLKAEERRGRRRSPRPKKSRQRKFPPPADIQFEPDIPDDFDYHDWIRRPGEVEALVREVPESLSEAEARKWAWDESDEYAIYLGYRFSLRRAMHYAYTLRNHCVLWEGPWSGDPFILDSWEIECDLRIFGWIRPSERRKSRWVRRFAKASTWVPKKNGKSPRGAAHCVYIWRFDGPWKNRFKPTIGGGNHVYCIAKNGIQAGRVWNHAKNMIENAPLLKHEIDLRTIAKNELRSRLEYLPKHSILTIVTGDSQRARDAAEGLNAKLILCDEAAVIDDRLVEITKDAGASHEDFLWSQISTYGSGEGYGKKDLSYGQDVASGKVKNASYFFKSYHAPPDCSDEDCGREEIWYQANPNLGNTVSLRQLRDSYEECKNDPAQFSGFKQRRLNIWQRASNPMIDYSQWETAAHSIPDIVGVGGGAAFDVGVNEDWFSYAQAWDDGSDLYVWGKIWACEDWIYRNRHRAPFEEWVEKGYITTHPGRAVDTDEIGDEIIELLRVSNTESLGYDKTYGITIAQRILKAMPYLDQGKFSQSVESYARGTSELTAALANGRLKHPGNPAIDWQAGHVMGKQVGKMVKPVKPERDGQQIWWAKVDTIQCITMAIKVKPAVEMSSPTAKVGASEDAIERAKARQKRIQERMERRKSEE